MSLGGAVNGLLTGLETAYSNAIENGSQKDNSDATLRSLANDFGDTVNIYYSAASVFTNVTIDIGQSDSVGGSTMSEGQGTGDGFLESLEEDILKSDLYQAFKAAAETGATTDPIPQLAQDVGDAIHAYMVSPTVITSVNTPGGQTSSAAAATANPAGTVTSPGTGIGNGEVSFESGNVSTLKSDVETAYNTAKSNGKTGSSLETLAFDIHTAVHLFALSAIINTDVDIFPGQAVAGYMVLAGAAPVPLPAVTLMGSGTGEGTIS